MLILSKIAIFPCNLGDDPCVKTLYDRYSKWCHEFPQHVLSPQKVMECLRGELLSPRKNFEKMRFFTIRQLQMSRNFCEISIFRRRNFDFQKLHDFLYIILRSHVNRIDSSFSKQIAILGAISVLNLWRASYVYMHTKIHDNNKRQYQKTTVTLLLFFLIFGVHTIIYLKKFF